MRLVCPNCQSAYEIPDAVFGAGSRRLRCARCASEWVAEPPTADRIATITEPVPGGAAAGPVAAAPESPGPAPVPDVRFATSADHTRRPGVSVRPPARRASPVLVVAAWVVSLAVLGAGAAAGYVWRADVMAAWPPSQRLYAALGINHGRE